MTNEKLARQWAESRAQFDNRSERERAAAEFILEHTGPETMEGVVWDDKKHYLAGAEFKGGGDTCPVVMVGETREDRIYAVDLKGNYGFWPMPEALTPNGKRYELREVTVSSNENVADKQAEPAHPKYLETLEDFQNAPDGTVISYAGEMPLTLVGGIWRRREFATQTHEEMAGDKCPVLRWGWGK